MAGTILLAAVAIDWRPPMVIAATKMVRIAPVQTGSRPIVIFVISTMELTWANVPIPKYATRTPKNAKSVPSHLYFSPMPFLI